MAEKKRYCVVGREAGGHGFGRHSWFDTVQEAVKHAQSLLAPRSGEATELLIVETVAVVKRSLPPVEVEWVE